MLVAWALLALPSSASASADSEVTGRWSGTDADVSEGSSSTTNWDGVATIERRGADEYTLVFEIVQQSQTFDHDSCSSTATTTGEATTKPEESGQLLFTGEAVTDIVSDCKFYESSGGTAQEVADRTTVGYLMEGDVIRLDLLPATSIEMQPEIAIQIEENTSGVTILDDGTVLIDSPPDGVLFLTDADIPASIGLPLARLGDFAATLCAPDAIVTADWSVLLNGVPIARLGDETAFGGSIVSGDSRVLINGVPAATIGSMTVNPKVRPGPLPCVGGPIVTGVSPTGTDLIAKAATGDEEAMKRLRRQLGTIPAVQDYPEEMAATSTSEDAAAGDTVIEGDFEPYEVGDGVVVGTDAVDIGIVESKGSIVLDRPLTHDHPAGTTITRVDADLIDQAREQIESGTVRATDPSTGSAAAEAATESSSAGSDDSSFPTLLIVALLAALVAVGGGTAFYMRLKAANRSVGTRLADRYFASTSRTTLTL